jgi:hypothetical protein
MDFQTWLLKKHNTLPDADRLVLLIQQAGPNGIPEGQLRSQVDLPMKLVDDLLAALVSACMVGVVVKGGKTFYFSRF